MNYLIWSFKHRDGSWWRSGGHGYTWDIASAGRFSEGDARAEEARTEGECVAIRADLAYAIVTSDRAMTKDRAHSDHATVRMMMVEQREATP